MAIEDNLGTIVVLPNKVLNQNMGCRGTRFVIMSAGINFISIFLLLLPSR